jgi:Cys-tRNA(Pro)/Cys-tRNA(Cys) deacylase
MNTTMSPDKLPSHLFLDEHGIPYERLTFPTDTEKGAANVSAALGYREDQMVKTLIFESHTGERVLVLVGGNRNAISGLLKKAIGSRNIKMAPLEAVQETTGYAVGSVPPFHWQPEGFRSFIDQALMREDILGVGAGVWGEEIMITPQDLQRACNGIVVNLTERPAES